jgi:parallel beta-helix repeat protein
MKRTHELLLICFFLLSSLCYTTINVPPAGGSGPTYLVGGHITSDTTWSSANSPYIVGGNVTVDSGATLTIEPGTTVKFNRSNSLFVEGALLSEGEKGNPIQFTSNLSPPLMGDWIGLKFNATSEDSTSAVKYSIIEHAEYGIWCDKASPDIVYNTITNGRTKGIYLQESESLVAYNTITNVSDKGIDIYSSTPRIESNVIVYNTYYGIKSYQSSPIIKENIIAESAYGIYLQSSQGTISNNIISSTGYGIYAENSPTTSVFNNTLELNTYGISLVFSNSTSVTHTAMLWNDFGVYTQSSSVAVTNSTIANSINKDFFLSGRSHITTINSTFDDAKLLISSESVMTVQNYLTVEARYEDNSPMPNASVNVRSNGVTEYSTQTENNGIIGWMEITDREYIGSTILTEYTTAVDVSYGNLFFLNNPRNVDMNMSHIEVFRVGNIVPILNITSPGMNESVWGRTTIVGIASDSDGQIVAVELKIGSNDWQPLDISPAPTVQWEYEWDTLTVANGTVYVFVRTLDSDDGWNVTLLYVMVENHGPIIEVTSHTDGELVRGLVEIIGETTDDRGNVTSVMVQIDDGTWSSATVTQVNWTRWAYTFDTRELTNGGHVISIRAQDDQPANSTISLILHVDNPKPFTQVMDWLFLVIVLIVIATVILVVIATHKRGRSRTEAKKEEETKAEISSEERIEKLRKAFEDGLISRRIYELNLAKLKAEETETTKQPTGEEAISYMCPKCDNEVDADATKCDNCGAVFED